MIWLVKVTENSNHSLFWFVSSLLFLTSFIGKVKRLLGRLKTFSENKTNERSEITLCVVFWLTFVHVIWTNKFNSETPLKILTHVSHFYIPNCAFSFSTMITFAQYLQRCSYDGLSKLVKDVVDLAHTCVANEDAPDCTKPLVGSESFNTVFFLTLCSCQDHPPWGLTSKPFRCRCCHRPMLRF